MQSYSETERDNRFRPIWMHGRGGSKNIYDFHIFSIGTRLDFIWACLEKSPVANANSDGTPASFALSADPLGDAMTKVLVVDSEARVRRILRAEFELHGFSVIEAENGAAGLRAATMNTPDLIILDTNLPDLEGSEVLERVRSWSNVPVIVLSIQSDEREKVRLLKLGADDYVVKPFGIAELLARSEAALRRNLRSTNRDPVVRAGPLAVDLVSRAVTLNGTPRAIDPKRIRPHRRPRHSRRAGSDASAVDPGNLGQSCGQHSVPAHFGTQASAKDRGRRDASVADRQRVRVSAIGSIRANPERRPSDAEFRRIRIRAVRSDRSRECVWSEALRFDQPSGGGLDDSLGAG